MAEPTLKEFVEKAQIESNLSNTNDDMNIELSKEFLMELQKNTYHRRFDKDVVDHIAKIDEGEGKITTWEELVDKFFCKFYLDSYDGEDEMLDDGDNCGIDPLEFISRMNGSWNKRRIDDSIFSSNDTTTDLFFKPYLKTREKNNIEKDGERRKTKRKCSNSNLEDKVLNKASNSNNEQPNKKVCKAEKFEAIKYSLGPNKE
ncbi:hypothetical protein Tco_1266817, partial [Tanacetum coccineum]